MKTLNDLPLPIHPACDWAFSEARVEAYRGLLRDGSLPAPALVYDGQLLDGRHRALAWMREGRPWESFPYIEVPLTEDPYVRVFKEHCGSRAPTAKEMAEQVTRAAKAQGKRPQDCLYLVTNEALRGSVKFALDKAARLAAKAVEVPAPVTPSAPRIHKNPTGPFKAPEELVRVIVPDSHGEHIDLEARDAFLSDLKALAPLEIVMLGDHLDAGGTFSSHQRSFTNEMTESYEADCKAANAFLDEIQRIAPSARIYYLEGNHEQHVERWAARECASHKDAVMFADALGAEKQLHLSRRGIQYFNRSTMYMGLSIPGAIKLGECYFVHGIAASKHATHTHLARFGGNVVHGHTHRVQSAVERTVSSAGFGAWCPGTLAKLQPLYAHTAPTSWSHGYGAQFVARSGAFLHVNVPIHKGVSLLPCALRKGK